jgi:hypothetical protein
MLVFHCGAAVVLFAPCGIWQKTQIAAKSFRTGPFFAEFNGAELWVMLMRVVAMLSIPTCLSDVTVWPSACADCVRTAQTAMATRSWPVRQELLIDKIFTIAPFMKRK